MKCPKTSLIVNYVWKQTELCVETDLHQDISLFPLFTPDTQLY